MLRACRKADGAARRPRFTAMTGRGVFRIFCNSQGVRLWARAPSTMLRMVPLPALTRRGGNRRRLFPPPCSVSETGEEGPAARRAVEGARRAVAWQLQMD